MSLFSGIEVLFYRFWTSASVCFSINLSICMLKWRAGWWFFRSAWVLAILAQLCVVPRPWFYRPSIPDIGRCKNLFGDWSTCVLQRVIISTALQHFLHVWKIVIALSCVWRLIRRYHINSSLMGQAQVLNQSSESILIKHLKLLIYFKNIVLQGGLHFFIFFLVG